MRLTRVQTIMSTDDTITAWGNHVDGAVALTKLRGTEQFKDEMSHAIFRAVRTMMVCHVHPPTSLPSRLTCLDNILRPTLQTRRLLPRHARLDRQRRLLRRKRCQPPDPHLHRLTQPTRPRKHTNHHNPRPGPRNRSQANPLLRPNGRQQPRRMVRDPAARMETQYHRRRLRHALSRRSRYDREMAGGTAHLQRCAARIHRKRLPRLPDILSTRDYGVYQVAEH
jgi:hypothetical protein